MIADFEMAEFIDGCSSLWCMEGKGLPREKSQHQSIPKSAISCKGLAKIN
jgi:hypothetical protein